METYCVPQNTPIHIYELLLILYLKEDPNIQHANIKPSYSVEPKTNKQFWKGTKLCLSDT